MERSKQGRPTGYKYHKIDPECRTQIRKGLDNVIKDSAELSHWLDSRRRISSRIKHPALKRLYEERDHSQIRPDLIENIERFLAILDYAEKPQDFGSFDEEVRKGAATRLSAAETRRGFGNLHPLEGDRKGSWSVFVSRNWRITFRFERGEAFEINLEDYH
ncbi:MAG: type II toxin-antitoxin system RelE/ParE family toxin [Bryobacteraceae bacterium]